MVVVDESEFGVVVFAGPLDGLGDISFCRYLAVGGVGVEGADVSVLAVDFAESRGGHARLIIGYNLKKKTIIYTDSWGAMHARKTMPAADAMGMTMGRYIIKLR